MSNPSLRYQKAAEESSAEKKKVSIPLHLKAAFRNQSAKTLKASVMLPRSALISFPLATSNINEVFWASRFTCSAAADVAGLIVACWRVQMHAHHANAAPGPNVSS